MARHFHKSHPIDMIDYVVKAGVLPATWKPGHDPETVFVARTKQDVDRRFQLLLREKPNHVKLFLSFSDEDEKRVTDPTIRGVFRGIDLNLVSDKSCLRASGARPAAVSVLATSILALVDLRFTQRVFVDDYYGKGRQPAQAKCA